MRKTSVWALVTMAVFASVIGAACGDDSAESGDICADIDCASAPKFAELNWGQCTSCHSADANVRTKEGVPADSDYTTYAGVSSRIKEIANRVNDTKAPMPPATQLADADKQAFTAWGCCDGPE